MKYCARNESLNNYVIDGGLSQCFTETISTMVSTFYILLIGIPTIFFLKKRYPHVVQRRVKSIFYQIQVVFVAFLIIIGVVRFILQQYFLYKEIVYGYMIFSLVANFLSELSALILIFIEKKYSKSDKHSIALTGFWLLKFIGICLPLISLRSPLWWWFLKSSSDQAELSIWIMTFGLTFIVLLLTLNAPGLKLDDRWFQRLSSTEMDEDILSSINQTSWDRFVEKFKIVFYAIWPSDSYFLQFKVLLCVLILVAGRIVNLYIPITYKYVVDSLTPSVSKNKTTSQYEDYSDNIYMESFLRVMGNIKDNANGLKFRWDLVLIYAVLRILQGSGIGSGGLLNGMRTQLWITVQQYSSRKMAVNLFAHLHALSLRWHLSKKTGEVLRIMDRGTDSLQNLLSYILFNIVPTIVDIIIGIIYFGTYFNGYFALIVFGTMFIYLLSTILVTEWRTKYRRNMNTLDNAKNAKAVDSLLNFETVKYYGAEKYEVNNYNEAIIQYQKADWLSQTTLNILNLLQNVVINLGFLGGALLCASYIVNGNRLTVGDFVLYCTYIIQLNTPLNFFGTYYRMIQQNFIDMENMFELLKINQDVKDIENAIPLFVRYGEIEFKNVSFYYTPEKPILKNISFKIPAGQTFALVGNSGGGKSTIIRLIFRFYEPNSGQIFIDGQDIREVTQQSLRQSIGVVPQDTVLFNQTILENIRYGRLDATDEEIENAAGAADIHERIINFPEKYQTMVGERGLKLSGGEKQRVAIARTLLKAPKIVLLDEATSALDTTTERNIQASLNKISENRTCLTVAHRLSTVVDADQILVIQEGEIKERGRHGELINKPDGIYANLWRQQLSGENGDIEPLVNVEST